MSNRQQRRQFRFLVETDDTGTTHLLEGLGTGASMTAPTVETVADAWRECARILAVALEALIDNEHYDTGLQVTSTNMVEAETALNHRIALIERETA